MELFEALVTYHVIPHQAALSTTHLPGLLRRDQSGASRARTPAAAPGARQLGIAGLVRETRGNITHLHPNCIRRFVITEKAPTRDGPYHKGRAAIRHYANQTVPFDNCIGDPR